MDSFLSFLTRKNRLQSRQYQNVASGSNDLSNTSEVREQEEETEFYLCKKLSEFAKHSYAVMYAITLRQLFHSDNPKFCEKSLTSITLHLSLSQTAEDSVYAVYEEESMTDPMPFALSLKHEIVSLKMNHIVIIKDLISLALHEAEYDARWRVIIKNIAKLLNINEDIELFENSVADFIIRGCKDLSPEEKLRLQKRTKMAVVKRCALVSLAAVGGGLAVGATGGMAAPAIVALVADVAGSTAFGASVVAALSTMGGTALISSLFGTIGASLSAYKMSKRVGGIKEFVFGQLHQGGEERNELLENPHLSSTIAISGWITNYENNNFSFPWKRLFLSYEQYYLKYESDHLFDLGKVLQNILLEIPKSFLSSSPAFIKGVAVPSALLGLLSIIDFPWSVCCSKAVLVGKQLAEVLLSRKHGRKPVNLIGYSIGARVIYYCLLEMSERGNSEGIIEDVYLIGAPCPADPVVWKKFMRIVSGNLINAYSRSDMILNFMYLLLSLPDSGAAGTKPINISHRRLRNVELTDIITSHKDYPEKLTEVLQRLNVRLKEVIEG